MKGRVRDFRGVARPVGFMVMCLAGVIAVCAVIGEAFNLAAGDDVLSRRGGAMALLVAAAMTFVPGVLIFLYGRKHSTPLARRQATMAVVLIWLSAGVFGALPFVLGRAGMNYTDGFFEAVSGLTTTGATVITDIEKSMGRPLLLWRSVIQWLGGMGIVVLFVAVFPTIGAGGKHMFGDEVPGTTVEGLRPRIAETSRVLWIFYASFTGLEVLALRVLGISWFESICHAFTTLSTGGFSTRDGSIAAFESAAVELTVAAFMRLASVNYGLFYASLRGKSWRVFLRSAEFRVYVAIVGISVIAATIGILERHDGDLFESFRYAVFQVATFVSSTGYVTDNYMTYRPIVLALILLLMFIGGCAGSTAGGIKIERIVLLAQLGWAQLRRSFRPTLVHVVRLGRNIVQHSALTDVAVFFSIYMFAIAFGTGFVSLADDVPVGQAFGAVLSCISNMGPAPFYDPAVGDHFFAYSAPSKLFFSIAMLLGRLEFFTILALLVPDFWRR